MKVEKNHSIFVGESTRNRRSQKMEESQAGKKGKKTLYAGELNVGQDQILLKKKEAQKKALKVVTDTWEGEQKIDNDIKARRERIKSLQEEIGAANRELAAYKQRREELRESCGVEADSEEQKDLELLLKRRESARSGAKVSLTKTDKERLKELDAMELTEYQSRALEMDKEADYYRDVVEESKKQIEIENKIIQDVRLERLKKSPMLEAQKQADAIEEAASKEIVGMLLEESKDHVDEEQAEREEQAEKVKEEKEEQEELLEARRTEREEAEKRAEELAESVPMEEMLILEKAKTDVQKEVQDIIDKMKLIEEDIKGSMVDEAL